MSLTLYWQLDVADEPRRAEPRLNPALPPQISDRRAGGRNRFDYYAQIATAAAHTGFDGLYLPHRPQGDDNRIVAGVIARAAGHLALVPEFPASVGSAVYAAKQAVSFQRATHDRLGWAIAPDEDPDTRAAQADSVAQGDLAERLGEFLTVARGVHGARPYSFKGRHFEVLDGGFDAPLNAVPFPPVYLRGEDEAAIALSARYADIHLFTPSPDLAGRIALLGDLARQEGRHVAAGLIQPVLAREFADEAHGETAIPGLLAGDHDTVAAALSGLVAQGVEHLVLAASPGLEEAYRIGQHVLPRLRARLSPIRSAA